ncbi:MAG: hypothetical protein M3Y57_16340 [Acidobacteriota bacterium]|nr:hypothetical protein [Acidobacteriota bacterium]
MSLQRRAPVVLGVDSLASWQTPTTSFLGLFGNSLGRSPGTFRLAAPA